MGYRSEVVLAVSKDLMPHFLSVLAKTPDLRPLVFKDHSTLIKDYGGDDTFVVSWGGIKWYEGYPEIDALDKFIKDCDNDNIKGLEDTYEHFRFLRLGEDYDDMIEKGELHCGDICFNRSISF